LKPDAISLCDKQSWAIKPQGFVFDIEHRKGCDNVVPDALSRGFEEDDNIAEFKLDSLPCIDLKSIALQSSEYTELRKSLNKLIYQTPVLLPQKTRIRAKNYLSHRNSVWK